MHIAILPRTILAKQKRVMDLTQLSAGSWLMPVHLSASCVHVMDTDTVAIGEEHVWAHAETQAI